MRIMKNYFDFNLSGEKLLPIWIIFLVLFLAPYSIMVFKMQHFQPGGTPSMILLPVFILLILIAFFITFYIAKLTIENVSYKDDSLVFNASFGKYIGIVLSGMFLSIITLGIYMAWFIRDLHRFFIDNSSYKSNKLEFQGKGAKLFLILLLTSIIPVIVLTITTSKFLINYDQNTVVGFIIQIIMMIIMIPYMYFVYKWMVNLNYKEYNISLNTKFSESCGKIAIEMILSILTIGIYGPLAMLRLYKYFIQKTTVESDEKKMKFGYDIDQFNDFLFIWGQLLLTIVTLGIYYPWAFCKIGKRILSKTYLELI